MFISGIIGDGCVSHADCSVAVENSTCDDVTKSCLCEEAYMPNENGTFCLISKLFIGNSNNALDIMEKKLVM